MHEHDELHVCARCLEDVTPREEIGRSAKIACVINALACFVCMLKIDGGLCIPFSVMETLADFSKIILLEAVVLALSGMRGCANGEWLFRLSVMISAGGLALLIAVRIGGTGMSWRTIMRYIAIAPLIPLASVAALGAAAWKRVKPGWALLVALFPMLMFGIFLLSEYLHAALTGAAV